MGYYVLNLIINGLPSKLEVLKYRLEFDKAVLNLIINGLPSKRFCKTNKKRTKAIRVLNLIINGLPSKLKKF